MRPYGGTARGGLSAGVISAVELGARLEARRCRKGGLRPALAREATIRRYREILEEEIADATKRDYLMAVVRRGIDEVLEELGAADLEGGARWDSQPSGGPASERSRGVAASRARADRG